MKAKFVRHCGQVAAVLLQFAFFCPAVLAESGPASLAESGPAMSELNPNRPAPDGWLAPTLEGEWRFHVTAAPWLPDTVLTEASSPAGAGVVEKDLVWLLKAIYLYVPLDFEVRKGRFGIMYHNFIYGFQPDSPIQVFGPITLDYDAKLMFFDVGITYELGRWRLSDEPESPELMLEPYLEARIVHFPIDIAIGGGDTGEELGSQVPVLGMKAYIDLTRNWNLEFIGDYGGFGVDNNHQTYQGAAYLGYRFQGLTLDWNFQVGYRAMRIFEMRQESTDISLDLRGAQINFSVDF